MEEVLKALRALGDVQRVRALMALRGRELCACQIVELLSLTPSTVSRHMAVLKAAGLIDARKEGRWMYYRLAERPGPPAATGLLEHVLSALEPDETILADQHRLSDILTQDPQELCRNQANR